MKYWIMSIKGSQNASEAAERALNQQTIPDDVRVSVGDVVFVFVGKPLGAIRFKAVVRSLDAGRPVFKVIEEYRLISGLRAPRILVHGFTDVRSRIFEAKEEFVRYVEAACRWTDEENRLASADDAARLEEMKRRHLKALVGGFVIKRRSRLSDPWEYLGDEDYDLPDRCWTGYLYRAYPFETKAAAEEYVRSVYGDYPPEVLRNYQISEIRPTMITDEYGAQYL